MEQRPVNNPIPSTQDGLALYESHKIVRAARITAIRTGDEGHTLVVDGGEASREIKPGDAYFARHQPQVGGYFVRYEDGYESFSPAAAFEAGYSALKLQVQPGLNPAAGGELVLALVPARPAHLRLYRPEAQG